MGKYSNLIMTTKGKDLLAKAQTGVLLEFSKAMLGDGVPTTDTVLLNDLVSPHAEAQIVSSSVLDNVLTIEISRDNEALGDNIEIREFGIFAVDPDIGEILYAYTSETTNYDTLLTSAYGYHKWSLTLEIGIENVANVDVTPGIPPTTALATATTDGLMSKEQVTELLLRDDIRGTTQNVILNEDDDVIAVTHHAEGGSVVRHDIFTYGTNLITEVRTLGTQGATLTFIYHTDTLTTEVI